MYCSNCGNEIKEEDRFCKNCGRKNEDFVEVKVVGDVEIFVPPPPPSISFNSQSSNQQTTNQQTISQQTANQQIISQQTISQQNSVQVVSEDSGLVVAVKVFLILGTITTALLTRFVGLCWCIPMTIYYFNKVKEGQHIRAIYISCVMLFVSLIGGILMLCDKEH